MSFKFDRIDPDGIAELLKDPMLATAIHTLAEEIADNVRNEGRTVGHGDELPVKVDDYVTDRAASSVTLAHPAGLAVQAKHGSLTKAAAAAGLEVNAR